MEFFEKDGNITVMGWKLVTIRVSSNDNLSEKRIAEPGVYFLVDDKTCYYESEDMLKALSAIWQSGRHSDQQRSEQATPFTTELMLTSTEISTLAVQDFVNGSEPELGLEFEPETESAHEPEPTQEIAPAQGTVPSEAICFISDNELTGRRVLSVLGYLGFVKLSMKIGPAHAEGNERPDGFILYKGAVVKESCHALNHQLKVTAGVLEEDFLFHSPSNAARFVSGYKSINGPGSWKDEEGRTLSDLRRNCFMTKRKHPACRKEEFLN